MDGASPSSSDILGIELGCTVVRGVLLDGETAEIAAAAECAIITTGDEGDGGVIEPSAVSPSLDDLLYQLGIEDRGALRAGMSIGPKNSGVGSGPALPGWLERQAKALREPLVCAGDLGVAFVPARAVEAATEAARQAGVELLRVDLAPVAAARVLGDEVEDAISIGSGRGWRARLRDFEVLEAVESAEVDEDDPLRVIRRDGLVGPISRYSWVEIAPGLRRRQHLDLGQLAPAVGAAIGVAYGSPANLVVGRCITGDRSYELGRLQTNRPAGRPRSTLVAAPGSEATSARSASTSAPVEQDQTPDFWSSAFPRNEPDSTVKLARIRSGSHSGPADVDRAGRAPADRSGTEPSPGPELTESADPITMFSPDTDLERELDRPDGRLDLLLGFLVVLSVALLLVYLFL